MSLEWYSNIRVTKGQRQTSKAKIAIQHLHIKKLPWQLAAVGVELGKLTVGILPKPPNTFSPYESANNISSNQLERKLVHCQLS